jgi:hypothetical protein
MLLAEKYSTSFLKEEIFAKRNKQHVPVQVHRIGTRQRRNQTEMRHSERRSVLNNLESRVKELPGFECIEIILVPRERAPRTGSDARTPCAATPLSEHTAPDWAQELHAPHTLVGPRPSKDRRPAPIFRRRRRCRRCCVCVRMLAISRPKDDRLTS